MAANNRNRFPSSHLPEGWFPMGWSHELAKGEVKTLHYFDRELVMWRGDDGEVAVQDAFCLHLGAHRGIKGEVRGNDLMCPWHGWEYDMATGQSFLGPGAPPARAYEVRVEPGPDGRRPGPYVAETFDVDVEQVGGDAHVVVETTPRPAPTTSDAATGGAR